LSFFSDLFSGNFSSLGTDIEHAPSSLASHPSELYETLGGIGALATGGLAAGGLLGAGLGDLGAATAGLGDIGGGTAAGAGGDILTGGSALGISPEAYGAASQAGSAALDASGGSALGFAPSDAIPGAASASNPLATAGLDASSLGFEGSSAFDPATYATAGQAVAPDFSLPTGGDPTSFAAGAAAGGPTVGDDGAIYAAGSYDASGAGLDPTTQAYADSLAPQQTALSPGDAGAPTGTSAVQPAGANQVNPNWTSPLQASGGQVQPIPPGAEVAGPPAPVPAATPTPSGLSALSIGGVNAKDALSVAGPLASLGYLGYTAAKGPTPLPAQANQLNALTSNLQVTGNQQLAMAVNGQLTASQAATLAQQQDQLTAQWKQVLMNQGVTNPEQDSRWPQIQAQIDQQMTASTQTMIQTTLQTGLQLEGQASSNLISLAQLQVQQDTNYTNAIGNAVKALGATVAGGNLLQKVAA
jgi:hypothetical protein